MREGGNEEKEGMRRMRRIYNDNKCNLYINFDFKYINNIWAFKTRLW